MKASKKKLVVEPVTPAAAKAATHDCRGKINELLAPSNGRLFEPMVVNFITPEKGKRADIKVSKDVWLMVEKLDEKKRVKPPLLACSYCPFCGADMRTGKKPGRR